jgi:hypothetical protein
MASEPGTINFPALLDDVISLVQANNHASATLTAGINNSVLLIPVSQISEFSASGYATILDSLVNPTTIEIVKYTSKSGSDLVVPTGGRGQQGTSAAAFSSGAAIEQRPTARHHTVLADLGIAMQGAMPTNLYTNTNSNTISNTAAETSIFTGSSQLTGSAGSSRTVKAGSVRVGTHYRLRIFGTINTTGTPTLRVRAKLGSTTIVDTTAATTTTVTLARFWLTVDLVVTVIGAGGSVSPWIRFDYSSATSGAVTMNSLVAANVQAVDLSADQDFDVSVQWGAANANNLVNVVGASIDRVR